jgi:4-carboxymuconolactone decarboxylase
LNEEGLAVRRAVLGDEYVDKALAHDDALSTEFQEFVTEYCWRGVWTDKRLSRRDHSLLTLGITAALGRFSEFEIHLTGALRNGISPDELSAMLRQITVYCGVPAAVNCVGALRRALDDGVTAVPGPDSRH